MSATLLPDDGERHRFIALPYGVTPTDPGWTDLLIWQGVHRKLSAFMRQLVVGCDVYRLDAGEWKRAA